MSKPYCKSKTKRYTPIRMKILLIVATLPLAFTQKDPTLPTNCPPAKDPKCNNETQMLCPGSTDYVTGCQLPGWCQDMFSSYLKDNDGNSCPLSCPVWCNSDETLCSAPPANGCPSPGYCMPLSKDDNNCYLTCPVTCDEEEVVCPGGINYDDGCPRQDWCSYSYVSQYGVNCPRNCYAPPCNYGAGEVWCDRGTDGNGCWMGDYCATKCERWN